MEDRPLDLLWQRRRPKDYSRSLGVVLDGLAGSVWFKQNRHLGRIVQALRDTLPEGMLVHVAVEGFRRNTLHLRVDSSSHLYELKTIKEPLLGQLNEQVSGVFIRELRLTLGSLESGAPPRQSPPERPE